MTVRKMRIRLQYHPINRMLRQMGMVEEASFVVRGNRMSIQGYNPSKTVFSRISFSLDEIRLDSDGLEQPTTSGIVFFRSVLENARPWDVEFDISQNNIEMITREFRLNVPAAQNIISCPLEYPEEHFKASTRGEQFKKWINECHNDGKIMKLQGNPEKLEIYSKNKLIATYDDLIESKGIHESSYSTNLFKEFTKYIHKKDIIHLKFSDGYPMHLVIIPDETFYIGLDAMIEYLISPTLMRY